MTEPKISEADMNLLRAIALKMDVKIEGDWHELSGYLGHANAHSTRTLCAAFMRKIKPKDGDYASQASASKKRKAIDAHTEPGTPTPATKRAKKQNITTNRSAIVKEEQD